MDICPAVEMEAVWPKTPKPLNDAMIPVPFSGNVCNIVGGSPVVDLLGAHEQIYVSFQLLLSLVQRPVTSVGA